MKVLLDIQDCDYDIWTRKYQFSPKAAYHRHWRYAFIMGYSSFVSPQEWNGYAWSTLLKAMEEHQANWLPVRASAGSDDTTNSFSLIRNEQQKVLFHLSEANKVQWRPSDSK